MVTQVSALLAPVCRLHIGLTGVDGWAPSAAVLDEQGRAQFLYLRKDPTRPDSDHTNDLHLYRCSQVSPPVRKSMQASVRDNRGESTSLQIPHEEQCECPLTFQESRVATSPTFPEAAALAGRIQKRLNHPGYVHYGPPDSLSGKVWSNADGWFWTAKKGACWWWNPQHP